MPAAARGRSYQSSETLLMAHSCGDSDLGGEGDTLVRRRGDVKRRRCISCQTNADAGRQIGGRFFRYEFLMAILPLRKVKRSQPFTSTRLPSCCVPLNVHSDTPRLPAMTCLAFAQCASGNASKTAA